MILQILSILDLAAAITILFSIKQIAIYFLLFLFIKGMISLFSAISISFNILAFFLGIIDLIGAFSLFSIFTDSSYPFFLALVFFLKAIFCFLTSFKF